MFREVFYSRRYSVHFTVRNYHYDMHFLAIIFLRMPKQITNAHWTCRRDQRDLLNVSVEPTTIDDFLSKCSIIIKLSFYKFVTNFFL